MFTVRSMDKSEEQELIPTLERIEEEKIAWAKREEWRGRTGSSYCPHGSALEWIRSRLTLVRNELELNERISPDGDSRFVALDGVRMELEGFELIVHQAAKEWQEKHGPTLLQEEAAAFVEMLKKSFLDRPISDAEHWRGVVLSYHSQAEQLELQMKNDGDQCCGVFDEIQGWKHQLAGILESFTPKPRKPRPLAICLGKSDFYPITQIEKWSMVMDGCLEVHIGRLGIVYVDAEDGARETYERICEVFGVEPEPEPTPEPEKDESPDDLHMQAKAVEELLAKAVDRMQVIVLAEGEKRDEENKYIMARNAAKSLQDSVVRVGLYLKECGKQ